MSDWTSVFTMARYVKLLGGDHVFEIERIWGIRRRILPQIIPRGIIELYVADDWHIGMDMPLSSDEESSLVRAFQSLDFLLEVLKALRSAMDDDATEVVDFHVLAERKILSEARELREIEAAAELDGYSDLV